MATPGPYVAKMDAGSLREVWHTPLPNNNLTGAWLIPGGMSFHADGYLYASQGAYLYKVSASTGAIQNITSLPTGINPPKDSNFNSVSAFSDGTLVVKTQNRAAGCTLQLLLLVLTRVTLRLQL